MQQNFPAGGQIQGCFLLLPTSTCCLAWSEHCSVVPVSVPVDFAFFLCYLWVAMIADPMADLGASATATQTQQSTSSKDVVDPLVLNSNLQRIDHIHAVMGVASGCIAGTLGLTGLQGFGTWLCRLLQGAIGFDRKTHSRRPSNRISLLRLAPFPGSAVDLGFQNEMSAIEVHQANGVRFLHSVHSTYSTFVYSVLDFVLRPCVPVLIEA